jgi:hypothetical protein
MNHFGTNDDTHPRVTPMRMIVWLVAASLLAVAGSSPAQEKSTDSKLFLGVLDDLYGLKAKSIVADDVKPPSEIRVPENRSVAKTRVTITLSFTKDVKNLTELRSLYDTFTVSGGTPFRFDNLPLIFHFFDEDNVCIDKVVISALEGDLSGVKGEAFRVFLTCRTESFNRAKRIEARYYPPLP